MWLTIIILIILGLCLGSFTNALVWRLEEKSKIDKESNSKRSKKYLKDLSVVSGRSMCPNCHHMLAANDLIPILSWLSLRGKCRYCNKSISLQYPLVELVVPILFVISYIFWPLQTNGLGLFEFIVWLVVLILFVALSVSDINWFMLPDKLIYPLILLTIFRLVVVTVIGGHLFSNFVGALSGVLILGGAFYVLFQVSRGNWIGGGDVKLGVALGILIGGPMLAILLLFIASLAGTFLTIPIIIRQKTKKGIHIPFGPFLIASAVVCQLFGSTLINWYERLPF